MKIYEDYSQSPDEWFITSTLQLEDDGKFIYDELWTCYLASTGGESRGRWRQIGETIFFHPEHVEGHTYLQFLPGQERSAVEQGADLTFVDGFTLRLRRESARHPQPPVVKAAEIFPNEKPPKVTPSPPPKTTISQAKPLVLSPKLISLIRQWIDELPDSGSQNRIARLGRQFNVLPLHTTMIYLWALGLDGVVVCLDHEAFSDRPEPETNPLTIYAVLVQGAGQHPELGELIPPKPFGTGQCGLCLGAGWIKASGEVSENCCFRCNGLGWYFPNLPC